MFQNDYSDFTFPTSKLKLLIQFSLLLVFTISNAQSTYKDKDVLSSYNDYVELPRELVYAHLNKSTYIKGEAIGFSAYMLDKASKQLSTLTTNLYCIITDKDDKIIKRKLFKVENGVSNGLFAIDSLFTSGDYKFKAYTNWMRNFNEQNFFVESIRIIDPNIKIAKVAPIFKNRVDAQFLPEGGHFLADVKNVVGVVIKDALGFGIPFVEGQLIEDNARIITNFKANKLGIGRFSFTPSLGKNYQVKLKSLDKADVVYNIGSIESRGIALSLKQRADNLVISFKTNKNTLPSIKNKIYKLIIHNGLGANSLDIIFVDKREVNKLIKTINLSSGINIFTLFDDNNNPLLERLFFNYEGINFLKSDKLSIRKRSDSLSVNILYQNIDSNKFNNVSISVLPGSTNSYQHQHNLASYTLLQPYVKGAIENGWYYFTRIERKTKYELDNLLITQGWSSYNWHTIFNYPPKSNYAFENGIGFKANIQNSKSNKFLAYMDDNSMRYFELAENEKSFSASGLFPIEKGKINITELKKKGKLKLSSLYLQFSPSTIPSFDLDYNFIDVKRPIFINEVDIEPFSKSELENTQKLEEILINAKAQRIKKIKNSSFGGRIDIFSDQDRADHTTLAQYLRRHGFRVDDYAGNFSVSPINRRIVSFSKGVGPPIFHLNGHMVIDPTIFANYDMRYIDYVITDTHTFTNGIGGSLGQGFIKIFTLPGTKMYTRKKFNVYSEYDIPLTFNKSKKFYTPKYQDYQNDFFDAYGVIDWLPINKIDINGMLRFKIYNTKTPSIKLFMQGITDDGRFISEVRSIRLSN